MKRRCLNRKERFSVVSSFQRAIRLLCGFGDKKRPPTAVIGGRKGRLRQERHISTDGFVAIFDLSYIETAQCEYFRYIRKHFFLYGTSSRLLFEEKNIVECFLHIFGKIFNSGIFLCFRYS